VRRTTDSQKTETCVISFRFAAAPPPYFVEGRKKKNEPKHVRSRQIWQAFSAQKARFGGKKAHLRPKT
jgi:hypothetical protein